MITLNTNNALWECYNGAGESPNGDKPEFAEIRISVAPDPLDNDGNGHLILDYDHFICEQPSWRLVINLHHSDGFVAVIVRTFPCGQFTHDEVKAFAERHLDPVMTAKELATLGFTYEAF